MSKVTEVQDFQKEVQESETPVLLDFYAQWCGPCKALKPTLEHLAEKYDGKIKILKADIDTQNALAEKFEVKSIPTLLFIKGGEVKATVVGAKRMSVLAEAIENHIKPE